jgi:hypothetical protein
VAPDLPAGFPGSFSFAFVALEAVVAVAYRLEGVDGGSDLTFACGGPARFLGGSSLFFRTEPRLDYFGGVGRSPPAPTTGLPR